MLATRATPLAPRLDLSCFVLQANFELADVRENLSGGVVLDVTTTPDGRHVDWLALVVNDPPELRQYALGRAPELQRVFRLAGFDDVEGAALLAGGFTPAVPRGGARRPLLLAVAQEERLSIAMLQLPPIVDTDEPPSNVTLELSSAEVLPLPRSLHTVHNKGIEGLGYDEVDDVFWAVIEKGPMRILRIQRDTGAVSEPFDAQAVLGPSSKRPRGIVSDLAGLHFERCSRSLLVLSQESRLLVQLSLSGEVLGSVLPVGGRQPEGVMLTPDLRTMYVTSEPNQLLRYVAGSACGASELTTEGRND